MSFCRSDKSNSYAVVQLNSMFECSRSCFYRYSCRGSDDCCRSCLLAHLAPVFPPRPAHLRAIVLPASHPATNLQAPLPLHCWPIHSIYRSTGSPCILCYSLVFMLILMLVSLPDTVYTHIDPHTPSSRTQSMFFSTAQIPGSIIYPYPYSRPFMHVRRVW